MHDILSYALQFYGHFFFLLSLFVLLLYFYLIRFTCSLLSNIQNSKWGIRRVMGRGSIFLQFYGEKVRLHYLFS